MDQRSALRKVYNYVLDLFYKWSGLRMNMQKRAVWVGGMKGKVDLQNKINLNCVTQFGLLGITFHLVLNKMI